ncbi:MAG: hypothetical protein IPL53_00195 [Ignavibacteria bacterium]|nr:hypothetical protein [Ignavibacteria bacterium]
MKKTLFALLILITLSLNLYAQSGKVIIILKQPPPLAFKLENMWKVTLNNLSQQTYRVQLRGVATEVNEGFIADAVTGVFTLPPGVKSVTAGDIKPIKVNETNPKYEDVVKNVGTVPSGNYDICVYAIDAETGMELASDCISTEVLNLSQVDLLSPEDNFSVSGFSEDIEQKTETKYELYSTRSSQPVLFSWLPPSPVSSGQRVTYRLKIAQMYQMQSAYDAMQSNPLYYSADNLMATIYQYPVAARPLSEGRYAWQVEAFVNGVLMSSSEVWQIRAGNEPSIVSNEEKLKFMRRYWALNDGTYNSMGSESQQKKKPFMFSFNSKLYGENANRSGTGSDKEPEYGYWEVNPALSFYGLPFSAPMLFSSENSESRQNINTLNLSLDASVIKEFIMEKIEREKNKLLEKGKKEFSKLTDKQKDKLESDAKGKVSSKLNPMLKIMSSFRSLALVLATRITHH